jgi:cyanophycinase
MHVAAAPSPRVHIARAPGASCDAVGRAKCSPFFLEGSIMFRTLFRVALLVALVGGVFAQAAEPAAPKGSLVIVGGALRADNAVVWERIVRLAGGEGARIAVFASASASPEKAAKFNMDLLNQYGADSFFIPVAVKLAGTDYLAAADDPDLAAAAR